MTKNLSINRINSDQDVVNNIQDNDARKLLLHIVTLIKTGEIKPGQKFPGERQLVNMFNISRATVRTTLKFFEFLDLISIKVGKGSYLSENLVNLSMVHIFDLIDTIKKNNFNDLFETRKIIEIEMARLAVNNATQKDLKKLESIIKKMEKDISENNGRIIDSANMFHYKIFEASKNKVLHRIGVLLNELNHGARSIILNNRKAQIMSLKEHREILSAISNRDEEKVTKLMEKHLTRVERTYERIERTSSISTSNKP